MFNYVYEKKEVISVIVLFATVLGLLSGFISPSLVFSTQESGDSIQTVTPSPSGCWVMVPTNYVPGHEDWACFSLCTAGCDLLFRDPISKAACIASCYGLCYVPGYWEYERVWLSPCPQ